MSASQGMTLATARVPLCDYGLCVGCGRSHRLPVPSPPGCCEAPVVISLHVDVDEDTARRMECDALGARRRVARRLDDARCAAAAWSPDA